MEMKTGVAASTEVVDIPVTENVIWAEAPVWGAFPKIPARAEAMILVVALWAQATLEVAAM